MTFQQPFKPPYPPTQTLMPTCSCISSAPWTKSPVSLLVCLHHLCSLSIHAAPRHPASLHYNPCHLYVLLFHTEIQWSTSFLPLHFLPLPTVYSFLAPQGQLLLLSVLLGLGDWAMTTKVWVSWLVNLLAKGMPIPPQLLSTEALVHPFGL